MPVMELKIKFVEIVLDNRIHKNMNYSKCQT